MEADQPAKQSQELKVEYLIVDEGESSALDSVFDMLFELLDKNETKK